MPSDVTRAKAKEREAMKQQQRPLPAILGIAFLLNAFKWTVFLCCLGFVIWGWWESSEWFVLRANYLNYSNGSLAILPALVLYNIGSGNQVYNECIKLNFFK